MGRCYQAALAGNQDRPRETCMEAQLNIVTPTLEFLSWPWPHSCHNVLALASSPERWSPPDARSSSLGD